MTLGAGPSHTLYVVRNQGEKDAKALEKVASLDQSDMD